MASTALAAALALSACATTDGPSADASKASQSSPDKAASSGTSTKDAAALREAAITSTKTEDYVSAAAYWGNLYERQEDDPDTAVNYSKALRQIGSIDQAGTVMQRAKALHGESAEVQAEYGKVLAASGHADQAVPVLNRAAELAPKDWTILSAAGVALDQTGRYGEAQEKYKAALKLDPGNPSVLTNLGLSYALQGDLDHAEQTLRQAVADPRATASARQNLVVVLGLKGNFDEASRIARADLPPEVAENNIAYLREMLTQPALWKQMEQLDKPAASAAADQVSEMPPATTTSLH
ncbi:tetratricopeptide repeat protein [Parvibaculum sp.]|uniref:tetratricopeptide repeat protein n=1 Tax=Parvibaculum sp. TaxID=2024848 RepID=UPI00320D6DE4